MTTNLSKKTILGIVLQVRKHGVLFVATDGSLFKSKLSAESTLRTKNMIIGDPTSYLGYIKLEADAVSNEKLKEYALDTKKFDALFAEAVVPHMRASNAAPKGRQQAERAVFSHDDVSEVEALLGIAPSTSTCLVVDNVEDTE